MPLWESTVVKEDPQTNATNSTLSPTRYPTRFSMRKKQEEEKAEQPLFSLQSILPTHSRPTVQLHNTPYSLPPPTQPARPRLELSDRWCSAVDSSSSFTSEKFPTTKDLNFDTSLDLADNTIVDFFQASFWEY